MKKSILYIIVAGVVVVGGLFIFKYTRKEKPTNIEQSVKSEPAKSYTDLGYKYFGNEAVGDLDGDGVNDSAFLLVRDEGGSGTFYYLGVAFKTPSGYFGTNAIFLGDRIAPQTTEILNKTIIVNYADRKDGEPMTAQPSVGVSKYFKTLNGIIVPIK